MMVEKSGEKKVSLSLCQQLIKNENVSSMRLSLIMLIMYRN